MSEGMPIFRAIIASLKKRETPLIGGTKTNCRRILLLPQTELPSPFILIVSRSSSFNPSPTVYSYIRVGGRHTSLSLLPVDLMWCQSNRAISTL